MSTAGGQAKGPAARVTSWSTAFQSQRVPRLYHTLAESWNGGRWIIQTKPNP
jgi:hypothetical protein